MRAVIQRVANASVVVEGKTVGVVGRGLLIFLGVASDDDDTDLEILIKKIPALRIFPDTEGKMNLSVGDIAGELLVISQFTLLADTSKGNRPSFFRAAPPDLAKRYYEIFISRLRAMNLPVQTGVFGADMQVSLLNEGPVTILFDTKEREKL